MNLRQLINLHVAVLTVLSAALWGLGRGVWVLPIGAIAAAALAAWLTDATKRFALSSAAVNASLVLIMAGSIWRLAMADWLADLVVMCDAFVWLQLVLLFERKSVRSWWDLIGLSLFLVLLSTLLPQGPLFALLLLAYAFFALSTMALLLLHQERTAGDAGSLSAGRARRFRAEARVDIIRLLLVAPATLALGPLSLFLRYRSSPRSEPVAPRPVSPAGEPPKQERRSHRATPLRTPARDGITSGDIGREFWYRIARMTLATVIVSIVVFSITPRFGGIDLDLSNLWYALPGAQLPESSRSVGFSRNVRLGELGSLVEDQDEVFQLALSDWSSDRRYTVPGGVYVRGAVMTHYADGQWSQRRGGARPQFHRIRRGQTQDVEGLVRQEFMLKSTENDQVFCVWPVVFVNGQPVWYDGRKGNVRCQFDPGELAFRFELATTGFVEGVQVDLNPGLQQVDVRALSELPRESLPRLAGLADRWMDESGLPAEDTIARARFLASRLRESGQFHYSLESPDRDPSIDPIEDFLSEHPQGHCEHFATALALMLRSQGIPSRLVVGFYSDEYSFLSQAYRFRQAHAHAWVEAYIPPERLPAKLPEIPKLARSDWSHGGWLRLDPTPISSGSGTMAMLLGEGMGSQLARLREIWTEYVMGMSSFSQRRAIYGPAVDWLKDVTAWSGDPRFWLEFWNRCVRGGALVAVLLLSGFVVMCFRLGLLAGPFAVGRRRPSRYAAANGCDIAFYRRLEIVLSRHGWKRAAGQTHREFARLSGIALAKASGESGIAELPLRIVEAFYQVRFGQAPLAGEQAQAVEQSLQRLRRAGRNARRRRPADKTVERAS